MKRPHYAWIICFCCTLALFCNAGMTTTAFSVHQPYLMSVAGLTNTQSSLVVTIRNLSAFLSMFAVNIYHGKLGARTGVTLALLMSAFGFFLFGIAGAPVVYYISAVFLGFGYSLGGMIPASIIIGRWFSKRRGFALGICAAGTGVASIIMSPLLTRITEGVSFKASFRLEALICAAAAVLIYALLRDAPSRLGIAPYGGEPDLNAPKVSFSFTMTRGTRATMLIALILIGAMANTGFAHISVLYRTEGFSADQVSMLLSIAGGALIVGKCVYGVVNDRLGAFRSGFVFFPLYCSGVILCCLAGITGIGVGLTAMLVLGVGLPLSTVGMSVFAARLSPGERFAGTLQLFQMTYMIGALAFGPVPGMIADRTGSYVPFFILMAVFSVVGTSMVQLCLHKREVAEKSAAA